MTRVPFVEKNRKSRTVYGRATWQGSRSGAETNFDYTRHKWHQRRKVFSRNQVIHQICSPDGAWQSSEYRMAGARSFSIELQSPVSSMQMHPRLTRNFVQKTWKETSWLIFPPCVGNTRGRSPGGSRRTTTRSLPPLVMVSLAFPPDCLSSRVN